MKRHPHYFSNIYLHKIRGQKSQVLHELISMHFYPKQNLCSLFTKKFLVLGQDSKQHLLPNIFKRRDRYNGDCWTLSKYADKPLNITSIAHKYYWCIRMGRALIYQTLSWSKIEIKQTIKQETKDLHILEYKKHSTSWHERIWMKHLLFVMDQNES